MQQKPYITEWLKLDKETKAELTKAFKIGRSSGVEVVDNKVVCDGVTERDLEALNVGRMIENLGEALPWFSPTLCEYLFKLILAKYDGQDRQNVGPSGESDELGTPAEEVVAKRKGRPRKEAQGVPSVA